MTHYVSMGLSTVWPSGRIPDYKHTESSYLGHVDEWPKTNVLSQELEQYEMVNLNLFGLVCFVFFLCVICDSFCGPHHVRLVYPLLRLPVLESIKQSWVQDVFLRLPRVVPIQRGEHEQWGHAGLSKVGDISEQWLRISRRFLQQKTTPSVS